MGPGGPKHRKRCRAVPSKNFVSQDLRFETGFVQDRMWWLLIGNVELLRLELARVVSGRRTFFGFNAFWSMAIKWIAPYALVPTIMYLSAHRLNQFMEAIHKGCVNSTCVALSMSIAFVFSGVFVYFLVKPDVSYK